jgi:hypothetical protein
MIVERVSLGMLSIFRIKSNPMITRMASVPEFWLKKAMHSFGILLSYEYYEEFSAMGTKSYYVLPKVTRRTTDV